MIDKTFRAGEKFRPVRTESRKMQYLYDPVRPRIFMDSRDYEQIEIPLELAAEAMRWVLPNDEVDVLFVDERPSDLQVASAVDLRSPDRARGQGRHGIGRRHQAGDARVGRGRPGPLFIEEGESVRVDTRSGEYVSRA